MGILFDYFQNKKEITRSTVMANEQLQEVDMTAGTGSASGISFNQRFLMTNGRVRTNPGCLNPKILYPVGPVDPDVHSILFCPVHQETLLTVLAKHIDNQVLRILVQTIHTTYRSAYVQSSAKIPPLFLGNGPCGNINHIDVSRSYEDTKKGMVTEKMGKELA